MLPENSKTREKLLHFSGLVHKYTIRASNVSVAPTGPQWWGLIWLWGWINRDTGSGPSLMLKKQFHKRSTSGKRGNNNGWIWESGSVGAASPRRSGSQSDLSASAKSGIYEPDQRAAARGSAVGALGRRRPYLSLTVGHCSLLTCLASVSSPPPSQLAKKTAESAFPRSLVVSLALVDD